MEPTKKMQQSFQYVFFFVLSMLTFVLIGVIYREGGTSFRKFFGAINPLVVVGVVTVLGVVALHLLRIRFGFAIFRKGNLRDYLISCGLALPFFAIIILIDYLGAFPIDINVPFPVSLAFYPAMGYVAEILFLVAPLAVLTLFLSTVFRRLNQNTVIWVSIVVVSFAEALYQAGFQIGRAPTWSVVYVGLHLCLISFLQLYLYKRYDFASMYIFRISYYLLWHVLWGHLRLDVLF